jgi:hypothetical protein
MAKKPRTKKQQQEDAAWHVEHQLPRALGGGDDTLNLVVA